VEWVARLGAFSIFLGVCALGGFLTSFRERGYLGWFGLACLLAGGGLLLGDSGRRVLLWLALAAGLAAVLSAVRETTRRLRAIRDQQAAREAQLLAMVQAERDRGESEQ